MRHPRKATSLEDRNFKVDLLAVAVFPFGDKAQLYFVGWRGGEGRALLGKATYNDW